ncbi:MAG: hypothetical protein Q7S28_01765 [bacterium]|nr:hypothetical protein [bacterium]
MKNSILVNWVLRIAVAGEFFGHGMLAIGGKKDWIGWFAKFGVTDATLAAQLLLVLGIMDVALAILILVKPVRAALLWMAFWGFWTALMRPIVADFAFISWYDFIERWANWGAPLALLLMIGWPKSMKEWFCDSKEDGAPPA